MSLLEVDDLRVEFSTPTHTVRSVDGVSFSLDEEETIGIVGESGSGKSILSRAIMGLLPRSAHASGRVTFDGVTVDVSRPRQSRRREAEIAIVLQDPMTSLNPVVRIGRQITESMLSRRDIARADRTRRAAELLAQVGIPEPQRRLRSYPHQLSGGMRQRVAIAAALASSPRLLVADEPTTALDVTVQHQILDLLQAIKKERGMAMILVTHDLGVVAGRTDQVAVMYAGRVVERASTRRLFADVRHPYTQMLLRSAPRLEHEAHRRLPVIPRSPIVMTSERAGCAFAPRCHHMQAICATTAPPVTVEDDHHEYSCFFPVGTAAGHEALSLNRRSGSTAAGVPVSLGTASG